MTKPKTAQHTPGPWEMVASDGGLSEEGKVLILGPNPGYQGQSFIARSSKANARLIVAAPTIMSALREALLLAQETDHAESERLRKLFTEVLIQAGDLALREVYERP